MARLTEKDSVLPKVFHERVAWSLGVWIFLAAAAFLGWAFRGALISLYVGFGLAYAFWPVANWAQRRRIPRAATALALIAFLLGGLVLTVYGIGPALARDAREMTKDAPRYFDKVLTKTRKMGARFGIDVASNQELKEETQKAVEEAAGGGLSGAAQTVKTFTLKIGSFAVTLLDMCLIPVFFYYFMISLPKLEKQALELVPPRYREGTRDKAEQIDRVVSGYVRGQLTVALMLSAIYGVGLPLIGVKFGIFIGVVSGLLNLVPYLGQITGFVVAVFMVLVDGGGMDKVWMVLALFSISNYVEGTFITPKVVGNRVGLTEVETIAALLVGASFGGVPGIMLSVPVAAVFRVFLLDLQHLYRKSELYRPVETRTEAKSA